jgi:predicted unusual protein kinase regulating ubiquinone biosynthesis (AarF/ABC1/UbiB family)
VRARCREVERRLDGFGFVHGLRIYRAGSQSRKAWSDATALRETLQDLGPVFAAFGIYLSSRVDLFSPEDCAELARIPDGARALAYSHVSDIVSEECGMPMGRAFQQFDPLPLESRLAWQTHRATLSDGSRATVRILHPEFAACALEDDEFLVSCDPSHPLGAAAHDFRAVLRRSLDLRVCADALRNEARDVGRFEDAVVPRVIPEYTTAFVLALETLSSEVASCTEAQRRDVARQLCLLWLRQALEGRVFAVEPRLENVTFLANRRLSFTAGDFSSLPPASQEALWEYLNAASNDDPDAAAEWLLGQMNPTAGCMGEKAFVQQIRQIVPFRDGAWVGTGGQTLPERLFLQWQIALKCGYSPQPQLIAFWRGLFAVTAAARQMDPHALSSDHDVFLSAFSEYRTIRLVNQIQSMMDVNTLGDRFDRYTMAAVGLPQRLNQLLESVESGRAKVRLQTNRARSKRDRGPAIVMLLALLSATALWTGRLSAHSANAIAIERAGAIVFFILGILLIRCIVKVH